MIRNEFPGRSLSGLGGIESGNDAAQFILLGADTVQVCTGVMKFGYECVKPMCDELLAFMAKHKFETLADFKGKSLDYFTTHADLVQRQAERKAAQKAAAGKVVTIGRRMERGRVREAIRRPLAAVGADLADDPTGRARTTPRRSRPSTDRTARTADISFEYAGARRGRVRGAHREDHRRQLRLAGRRRGTALIAGYAYASPHRAACRPTAGPSRSRSTSTRRFPRQGRSGAALYTELFRPPAGAGAISRPTPGSSSRIPPSQAFHEAMGFTLVGHLSRGRLQARGLAGTRDGGN